MDVLAVGAHPDDAEIGAGAFLHQLGQRGHDVWLLILSDDGVNGWMRRGESLAAAKILGIREERVLFGGLRDGFVRADGDSVTLVRRLTAGITPGLVVTHSAADSHNDHVEAERISRAAYRRMVFLHYSVQLSAEPDRFRPRAWMPVDADCAGIKSEALARHASQRQRMRQMDLPAYEMRMGRRRGCGRVEAFEVTVQEGADRSALTVIT